jgi:uncharacterized protein YbjQ (UPF0145 family)
MPNEPMTAERLSEIRSLAGAGHPVYLTRFESAQKQALQDLLAERDRLAALVVIAIGALKNIVVTDDPDNRDLLGGIARAALKTIEDKA